MPNITVNLINFHLQPIWSSVNEDEIKIERNNILTHRKIGKLILLWFHLSLNIGLWLLGCAAFALEMQRMQFASVSNTFAVLISYNIKIKMPESDSNKDKILVLPILWNQCYIHAVFDYIPSTRYSFFSNCILSKLRNIIECVIT